MRNLSVGQGFETQSARNISTRAHRCIGLLNFNCSILLIASDGACFFVSVLSILSEMNGLVLAAACCAAGGLESFGGTFG